MATVGALNCPNCNTTNPKDAKKCKCGYIFKGYKEPTTPEVTVSHSHDGTSNNQNVIVTDIKMSFGSMVEFMVKWVIASIPAFIILCIIGLIVAGIFGIGAVSLFK